MSCTVLRTLNARSTAVDSVSFRKFSSKPVSNVLGIDPSRTSKILSVLSARSVENYTCYTVILIFHRQGFSIILFWWGWNHFHLLLTINRLIILLIFLLLLRFFQLLVISVFYWNQMMASLLLITSLLFFLPICKPFSKLLQECQCYI